jgi:4-amino-4-deoxy-L-arabinose transferase-like glycosyltransferase
MNRSNFLIAAIFLAAAILRFADVFRPINQASWREADIGAISRNFAQEGMNPLYPRIDWRGDGPGFAEMELPLYPWLTALTYKIFGVHDQIARVWAFLFSLGAMFFFFKLARQYLSPFAATIAFAFFSLNPLMVGIATAIQPEGLMIFTYITAVFLFIRWLRTDESKYFWTAATFTALTLLAKAPTAHIGLFFGVLLIEKYGLALFRRASVWAFALLSVLPSALWYFHAKNLWIVYGNSLGVSNEYHWIGWDFFTNLDFISGILSLELAYVWISFGLIVGAFAIWQGYREEPARHALLWLASVFALYLLAARTTSEHWAFYYHVFSIPPVALIFGFSIKKLWDYARDFADRYSLRGFPENLGRVFVILLIIGAILASLRLEAKQVRWAFLDNRRWNPAMDFAERIQPLIGSKNLILVSGGPNRDPNGYQLAYNASYMFYWLEKKGWNTCVEEQTVPKIAEFRNKGAAAFVGEKKFMGETPTFESELRAVYPVTAESGDFILFDLEHPL